MKGRGQERGMLGRDQEGGTQAASEMESQGEHSPRTPGLAAKFMQTSSSGAVKVTGA